MGIVNRDNRFNDLIRVIRSSKLRNDEKKELIDYVLEVKNNKRNNDFLDDEFLERVFLELSREEEWDTDFDLWEIIGYVKFIFPYGTKTEDYELLKEVFLNNLGNLSNMFNDRLFALFDNKRDYFDVISILDASNEDEDEEFRDTVINYGVEVSTYCQNQYILKQEIIAFINKLEKCSDYEDLKDESLEEAKKRAGIYPVDEKTLSLIASEAKKAQNLISKLENLQTRVNNYQKDVDVITKKGLEELQGFIDKEKDELIKKLDEYLLEIEKQLKDSSDKVFNEILLDAQKKINEIKLMASSLSSRTTDELLRIQRTSEESVSKLKEYVENNPKVQELIKEAGGEGKLKDILTSLQLTGAPVVQQPVKSEGIYIAGNDRVVVPMNSHVQIPSNIDHTILPAFDESIPFDDRIKMVMQEMDRRKAQGEIFHEMTEEVVRCVMEGDWVYLWGPSGCGKSYVIHQVAELLGLDLVDNGKITDKYSIMAYNDPHGRFRATQAFVALVYGKMLSLDEFDNGNTDTQVVLNELYSGLLDVLEKPEKKRFVTFAEDMSVPIHPNFRMISAGNTPGDGDDGQYLRGQIDEAVQERMTPKKFFYDNRVEKIILNDYDAWYDLFTKFRKVCDDYAKKMGLSSAPGMITTRDASALAKYIRHNSKVLDQVLREKFIQVKDDNYLKFIMDNMRKLYNIDNISDVKDKELRSYTPQELGKKLIYTCNKSVKEGRR